jgi:hypothetical protein
MISKLERGEKNPTLVVAARLAEGWGEPVAARRYRGEKGVVVVREERRMVMRDPRRVRAAALSPSFGGRGWSL